MKAERVKRNARNLGFDISAIGEEMPVDAAAQALALLARWAIRKAQKRAEREVKPGSKLVTDDTAKSCTDRIDLQSGAQEVMS